MSKFGNHNVSAMTRRVLKHYDAATPAQLDEGTAWYRVARTFCADLANGSEYTFEQVAYVCAALSPQVNWDANMKATRDAVKAHETGTPFTYGGYGANAAKALKILDGDLTVLRGPKVTSFAHAIMGDLSQTVVDVWATRAARSDTDNVIRAYADDEMPGAREHRAIAEAYRRAAAHRGIAPAECQAGVWVKVRASNEWVRPQHLSAKDRARFWARQARARVKVGLTVPYDYNNAAPSKVLAYG